MASTRTSHSDDFSDHQHDVAWDNDSEEIVSTVGFDYDEIDRNCFDHEEPETQVAFSDMTAALSLILGWICASPDIAHCGGRAAALLCMIDPINLPHHRSDLTAISKEVGVSKQAVSKWLCDLRDQTGVSLTVGKRSSMRETYRASQLAAVERGTHASFVRKDAKAKAA